MKTLEEREREFMIGLAKLTRKTGITISGCGCCSSPRLDAATEHDALSDPRSGYGFGYAGEVCWLSPKDEHNWKDYSDSIVRPNDAAIHGGLASAGDVSDAG